ncbi:ArsA family ATPase [uncultured Thiohalocapsa sp.]|uniref:ArsA family ATPase n=1 Tax=uncultured Thiohalocapsa sp. TaxID=768990 RepID=UPI0025EBE008|nr:ArsA family ATPase [uncultured Thiohalocapsa sp.]
MSTPAPVPGFLEAAGLMLLFFGGKGGVGKTSCACAAAFAIARRRPDEPILLLSTDPAHSVSDALASLHAPGNLEVLQLDADASLRAFRERHRALLREISQRGTLLDNDDIDALLEVALPGLDELAAYLELADWIEQARYACIVVDTAPTGHALRLLAMPGLVRRWLDALDALLAKHRYLRRRFGGDARPDHLDDFLARLDRSRGTLVERLTDAERCRFVPVTLAERMSVAETQDLLGLLGAQAIPVSDLVVNRLVPASPCEHAAGDGPEAAAHDLCPVCAAERERQIAALAPLRALAPDARLLGLPLLADEPRGADLAGLFEQATTVPEAARPAAASAAATAPWTLPVQVAHAAPLPPPGLRLLVFAGKGGVGKSTLACATALHLNRVRPAQRLLLFSTDPAHSLADALGRPVGSEPTLVRPGLEAQEVDAEGAFAAIRAAYRDELERLLMNHLGSLDITFDRQVMERLLDLAPPGLDEVMALTTAIDHLDADRYDLIVLDAAPSGHLLRLLELPELIGDWLKLFFQLLLKYRDILRLPRLSEQLVALSRATKRLRALLADPHRTRVQVVSVATALGLAETGDLTAALADLSIAAPVLALNQLTPPGPADCRCALCSALRRRESEQVAAAARFAPMHRTLVYRQHEPAGLDDLAALGAAFYGQRTLELGR